MQPDPTFVSQSRDEAVDVEIPTQQADTLTPPSDADRKHGFSYILDFELDEISRLIRPGALRKVCDCFRFVFAWLSAYPRSYLPGEVTLGFQIQQT